MLQSYVHKCHLRSDMRKDSICLVTIALAACVVSYNSLQHLSNAVSSGQGTNDVPNHPAQERTLKQPIFVNKGVGVQAST